MTLPSAATVERILRLVEPTDIEVLELKWGEARIRVTQDAERFTRLGTDPEAALAEGTVPILAPLTGVFYGRPSPDQPAFVQAGGRLNRGQIVGLIETMKLFNEVVAEIEGEVVQVLVSEGDLVEANQPLMLVRADEGSAA